MDLRESENVRNGSSGIGLEEVEGSSASLSSEILRFVGQTNQGTIRLIEKTVESSGDPATLQFQRLKFARRYFIGVSDSTSMHNLCWKTLSNLSRHLLVGNYPVYSR